LRQVARVYDLHAGQALFTRCLVCNSELQPRFKAEVEKLVPPFVFASQERFSWCGRCQKVYWPATHQQKMLDVIVKIAVP
jgi:uncharacterized protein with PIN domain